MTIQKLKVVAKADNDIREALYLTLSSTIKETDSIPSLKEYQEFLTFVDFCVKVESILEKFIAGPCMFVSTDGYVVSYGKGSGNALEFKDLAKMQKCIDALSKLGFAFKDASPKPVTKTIGKIKIYTDMNSEMSPSAYFDFSIENLSSYVVS